MKIITGSSLYELMKYGENIDKDIKKNDIKSIERKVETKTTEYVTVLFFQKNFMALSTALFLIMISWVFITFTILRILNIKHSPALHFSLYMALTMIYIFIYIGAVFLIARGITTGVKMIYFTFVFIVCVACIFSLYYLVRIYWVEGSYNENIFHIAMLLLPLYFSRLILNTTLIRTAIMWTINERARKAYWKIFMKDYKSPRKIRKLRVG